MPMPEKIELALTVGLAKGPTLASRQELAVAGYEKLEVGLAAGTASGPVTLLPDAITANVLMVSAITYDAGGGTVPLAIPLVLLGPAVSLLGSPLPPFTFTNGAAADAVIEILVGRTD